ncbi:glycosyltransferase family 4 protein [Steroidobacter sp.]|uniref:glycosyltransferase family 4 protein n=1 Tax=Steroidobacter sp. TaxID=1978227 RepID=UPI001A63275B|nr:glycosyltransferase family 4 protein [Steroidobacter sp.]MBL8270356.1 glycosyltransferase family 4 protein [Steroidobacter sp.]
MKICIVGLDDYPQLAQLKDAKYVGGESVQHVLLARAWRDLGHDVSMIVHDYGQGRDTTVGGIRAVAPYSRDEGIPVLRFAHPRLTGMIGAMREIDADVYYQSPAGAATGITAWFCRRYGKRFIMRVASDLACIPGKQLIRYWRDRKIYEYGVRNADLIVAQSEQQRTLLRQNYGVKSEVLDMAVEMPSGPQPAKDIDVLWVANLRPVKRPEIVLELARRLPNVRFTLAGGALPGAEDYYRTVLDAASAIPNVICPGAVPYTDVGAMFSRAKLFLNTSEIEGFPNTFLQAWVRAVPVVAFFDPDSLIKQRQLGHAVTDLDDMVRAIERLLADDAERERIGERARAYAIAQFGANHIASRYLDMLSARDGAQVLNYGTSG